MKRIWPLSLGCLLALAQACSENASTPSVTSGAGGATPTGGAGGGAGTALGGAAGSGTSGSGGTGVAGSSDTAAGGTAGQGGVAGQATGGVAGGGTAGDAGSAATGGSSGSSTDPCAGALLCESFEDYPAGSAPSGVWTEQATRGSVSIDNTLQVSGNNSARFTTEASSESKTAYLRFQDASVLPVVGNAFYGRLMFFLESAPTDAVHWTFIQGGGTIEASPQSYRALYRYGGQHPVAGGNQLMANYETPDSYSGVGPRSDCWHHSTGVTVPTGAWHCAEWQFDGPNNTMRFWLDGEAIDSLTVMGAGEGCGANANEWIAPTFEYLEIGWESYQADEARTLYVDDVVLSTAPIGCP